MGLGLGVTVTGVVSDQTGTPVGPFGARVTVFNADSGDETGADDPPTDGVYTLHVTPRQSVVLSVDLAEGGSFVYQNGTPIKIDRPGPIVVNLTQPLQS